MRLHDYLKREKLTYACFGKSVGVSAEAVRRYATLDRVPTPEVMKEIIRATDNQVQPNDFFAASTESAA